MNTDVFLVFLEVKLMTAEAERQQSFTFLQIFSFGPCQESLFIMYAKAKCWFAKSNIKTVTVRLLSNQGRIQGGHGPTKK